MKIQEELEKIFNHNRIRVNEPMEAHTSFKCGGPAEYYLDVDQSSDLIKAVSVARTCGVPVTILGSGTYATTVENGIEGLVIKNNCRKFEIMTMRGRVVHHQIDVASMYVYAESGVIINQLVRYTLDESLEGLEYALGLPGTIGGAVYANSYFPKKEICIGESVSKVKILTPSGEIKEVDQSYCSFSPAKSSFQTTQDIILSVIFELRPGDKKILWERGTMAVTYRSESQPENMIHGCLYRNYYIDNKQYISEEKLYEYFARANLFGKQVGNAMISQTNPHYIVNTEEGTVEDIVLLIAIIKKDLLQKCGVIMHCDMKSFGV